MDSIDIELCRRLAGLAVPVVIALISRFGSPRRAILAALNILSIHRAGTPERLKSGSSQRGLALACP
jgi:hypothetical protein